MSLAATILVSAVRIYRWALSPILPFNQCRFLPTCSEYARLALMEHGLLRGAGLALLRLVRCHPFHPGGCGSPPPPPRRLPWRWTAARTLAPPPCAAR